MSDKTKSILCVVGCHVWWGLFPIYWHQLNSVPALYVLASRIGWGLVFCLLILAATKSLKQAAEVLCDRKQLIMLMLAGVLVAINWGLYIYSVHIEKVFASSLAYYMNPIVSVIIGLLVFKERLTARRWVAVALAAVGVVAAALTGGAGDIILSLGICLSFAIYGAVKKTVKADTKTSVSIETLTTAPFAIAYMIFSDVAGAGCAPILGTWRMILLPLAGLGTIIPLLLYSKGVKGLPYSLSGMLMYINPTLQFFMGLCLGEQLDSSKLISFIFVWTALILYLIPERAAREKKC